MKSSVGALCLLILTCTATYAATLEELVTQLDERYKLANPYDLLVNDRGAGFEPLNGVRNFRVVLKGVVYRGGANNVYRSRYGQPKRANTYPLPPEGLRNLCSQGFGTSVYLYTTNYSTADRETACDSGVANKLAYISNPLRNREEERRLILSVKQVIDSPNPKPIFLHCWNGWHATGLASALILRQFCDVKGITAVKYWDRTKMGPIEPYMKLRSRIQDFEPFADVTIPPDVKALVCPKL